jgi:hypothetical protein
MSDISSLISIGSFLLGASGSAVGSVRWFRESQRKQFAAERDVEHLKRDNVQLREYVIKIDDNVESLTSAVVEMRSALSIVLRQCQVVKPVSLPTFAGIGERND